MLTKQGEKEFGEDTFPEKKVGKHKSKTYLNGSLCSTCRNWISMTMFYSSLLPSLNEAAISLQIGNWDNTLQVNEQVRRRYTHFIPTDFLVKWVLLSTMMFHEEFLSLKYECVINYQGI